MAEIVSAPTSAPSSTQEALAPTGPLGRAVDPKQPNVPKVEGLAVPDADKAPGNTEEFVKWLKEQHKEKIKANGKERELTYEQLVREASKGIGSHEAFTQASELRKQVTAEKATLAAEKQQVHQLIQQLRRNPFQALQQLGVDERALREMTENYVYDQMQLDKDPGKRQQMSLQKQQEEFEHKQRTFHQQQEQAQTDQYTRQYQQQFQREIPAALRAVGLDTKDAKIFSMVIDQAQEALRLGLPMDFTSIAENVKESVFQTRAHVAESLRSSLLSKSDRIEMLKEAKGLLGEDLIRAIQEGLVAEVKQNVPQPRTRAPDIQALRPADKANPGYISAEQWRSQLANRR